ncbi:hypothetical protein M427DRAFT_142583 [Gonapodya prolifera JEL478]|uniref:Uncharacterized protein n=1 Tax=Gonapodya prolifera (strain JEL478) TaxID=1344416 RepID=A0A139AVX9_GONPJ|nr:hypothetical protein M427DRAFT_142583 [Gonapodya prolifera JEL478]|eukprot:KXS20854.1 hypothetical protein M427DRAFT_142583 [Gonapodya prolifera JEL478]
MSVIARAYLAIFNALFILAGFALICLSAVLITGVVPQFRGMTLSTPVGVGVLGVVIALISSVGACGAIQRSRCCLSVYAAIVLLLAIGEIGIGVVAIQFNSYIQTGLSAVEPYWNSLDSLALAWFYSQFSCSSLSTCYSGLVGVLQSQLTTAYGVCIGFVVLQLLAFAASIHLSVAIRRQRAVAEVYPQGYSVDKNVRWGKNSAREEEQTAYEIDRSSYY